MQSNACMHAHECTHAHADGGKARGGRAHGLNGEQLIQRLEHKHVYIEVDAAVVLHREVSEEVDALYGSVRELLV